MGARSSAPWTINVISYQPRQVVDHPGGPETPESGGLGACAGRAVYSTMGLGSFRSPQLTPVIIFGRDL
jgi:hypothetical protein